MKTAVRPEMVGVVQELRWRRHAGCRLLDDASQIENLLGLGKHWVSMAGSTTRLRDGALYIVWYKSKLWGDERAAVGRWAAESRLFRTMTGDLPMADQSPESWLEIWE